SPCSSSTDVPQRRTTASRISGFFSASCPSASPEMILPPVSSANTRATWLLPLPIPPIRPITRGTLSIVVSLDPSPRPPLRFGEGEKDKVLLPLSVSGRGTGGGVRSNLLHVQPVWPRRQIDLQRHLKPQRTLHRCRHFLAHQRRQRGLLLGRRLEDEFI